MLEKIQDLMFNGWMTLSGLLKLEWLNFKNWKGWTALRALYLLCVVEITLDNGFIYLVGGSNKAFKPKKSDVVCLD